MAGRFKVALNQLAEELRILNEKDIGPRVFRAGRERAWAIDGARFG
jgi:hypothetical protein